MVAVHLCFLEPLVPKSTPSNDSPDARPDALVEVRTIKKYPNRRLYDTQASAYVTLAEVKKLVMNGAAMVVRDAKTGEDLTRSILLQIILEEESAGVPMFSEAVLSNIIRFYGHAMQGHMGAYLESNLQSVIDGISIAASQRNTHAVLHIDELASEALGKVVVPQNFVLVNIDHQSLGTEWEWENSPEVSIVVADSTHMAVEMFNRYSPSFVLSVVSDDDQEIDVAWRTSNAPFFGDGMTRWVDGQYALRKPELGLSNWQNGRTFARGGILSGDSIFTVRYRVRQVDPSVKR